MPQTNTNTVTSIVPTDKSDLGTTYSDLITANKRLIFLSNVGAPDDAVDYDSYNDADYATTNVQNIINALNLMTAAGQSGSDFTTLQLQGTATAIGKTLFASIVTMSDASSPLMSTKPGSDNQTYPWLNANVVKNLSTTQLVVFLNDFCDNALTSFTSAITQARVQP